jgi:hypothetical protein
MEAPEKIYLLPRQGGDYAPYWRTDDQDGFGIEYTRTDTVIDKAWNWIEDNILSSNQQDKSRLYFEQFKKYMKGE